MLWKRIASAVLLIPVVVLLIVWGGYLYIGAIALVAGLMLVEFHQLTGAKAVKRSLAFGVFLGLLFCVPAVEIAGTRLSVELALILTLLFAFAYHILRDQPIGAYLDVANMLTGAIYIGWLFGYHLISLRFVGGPSSLGSRLIFFLFVTVWCGDAAAYAIGKRFGKHRLRPQISPGKTIEGTIAGVAFGIIGAMVVWFFGLKDTLDLLHVVGLAVLLSLVGQLSDLSESIIKRAVNAKDSGGLLPGHGGLLDRCDSLILTAPTLYYYVQYVLPQHH